MSDDGRTPSVLYVADVSGVSGALRHRDAVVALLGDAGWRVEPVEGVSGPLRRLRSRTSDRSGAGKQGSVDRYLGTLLLLVNSLERLLRLLGRSVLRGRPDVVLWRPGLFQFHGHAAARLWRVPLVCEVNAPLAQEAGRFRDYVLLRLARWIEHRTVARTSSVVAVSEENALSVGRPDKTHVVHNGGGPLDDDEALDADRWGRTRCPVCRDPAATGRRHAVFLESFRGWHGDAERKVAVSALPEGWTALVIGSGPSHADFVDWALSSRAGKRVMALGHLPAHAVQHVLAVHADLGFVLYPPLESFYFSPLKLFDFLAHDVPVVATDLGQVGRIAREDPGAGIRLVAPGDLESLASTVRRICNGPSETAPTGGREGPYGWPATVEGYARVLTDALTNRRSPAAAATPRSPSGTTAPCATGSRVVPLRRRRPSPSGATPRPRRRAR